MKQTFVSSNDKGSASLFLFFFLLIFSITSAVQDWGYVTLTLDGDTLEVITAATGQIEAKKVRLYGIDCPETNQSYGNKATKFTKKCVLNKNVILDIHGVDFFGRLVATVYFFEDGTSKSLNEELLSSGFAWWYRKYAPKESTYQQLQAKAKKDRVGLWQEDDPIEPWKWRSQSKKRTSKISDVNLLLCYLDAGYQLNFSDSSKSFLATYSSYSQVSKSST